MKLKEGPISQNELMQRLVNSKKVMHKVESGDYTTGNIDEGAIISDEPVDYSTADAMLGNSIDSTNIIVNESDNHISPDIERIQSSKLPESIKKAMIDNPIQQIKLNDSLNMDFVKKTRQLMEEEGVGTRSASKISPPKGKQTSGGGTINTTQLTAMLTPIIENIVRKTLDEIVDKKLNQILAAEKTSTINENLALKVGDSIFTGKITGVKTLK